MYKETVHKPMGDVRVATSTSCVQSAVQTLESTHSTQLMEMECTQFTILSDIRQDIRHEPILLSKKTRSIIFF